MNASEKKYATTRLRNMAASAEQAIKARTVWPEPVSITRAELYAGIKDELMLGEGSAALALLRAFEEAHRP